MLPTPPAELTQPERLEPYASKPSGEMVLVDKGMLQGLSAFAAKAGGAVAVLNGRLAGFIGWARCQREILATGVTPAGC